MAKTIEQEEYQFNNWYTESESELREEIYSFENNEYINKYYS